MTEKVIVINDENEEEHEEDSTTEDITVNKIICNSICCKLDRPRPNQPTSASILNATKWIQDEGRIQQAQVVQSSLYPCVCEIL